MVSVRSHTREYKSVRSSLLIWPEAKYMSRVKDDDKPNCVGKLSFTVDEPLHFPELHK